MIEQWQELKETIIELRDGDGTGTQQEICKFLANYMDVLEKNVSGSEVPTDSELIARGDVINTIKETAQYHTGDSFNADRVIENIKQIPLVKPQEQEPCEDCISREKAKQFLYERIDRLNDDELYDIFSRIIDDMYNELEPYVPETNVGKLAESEE